jgi:TonB family protein
MSNSHRFAPIKYIVVIIACAVVTCASHYAQQDLKTTNAEKERGIGLYQQRNYSEAIGALRRAVAANKNDDEAWYYLGLSQMQERDLKAASKSFETALKLQPQFASAHAALSYAYLERNRNSEAAREAQAAIKLDTTIADAYYILGVTRLRAGDNRGAIENADKATTLRPEFAPSYLLKTQALIDFAGDTELPEPAEAREARKERYRKAVDALEKYLQLAPNAPQKQFWTDQLESLKFYVGEHRSASDSIFTSKQVTTRARVLSKPEPAYTSAAREHEVRGTVILRAVFAADGTVKHVIVVRGLPDGLTEVCISVAKKIKFVPAARDGKPVSMWMQLEYNFNIF